MRPVVAVLLVVAGAVLVVLGCWLFDPRLALVAGGAGLVGFGLLGPVNTD